MKAQYDMVLNPSKDGSVVSFFWDQCLLKYLEQLSRGTCFLRWVLRSSKGH